jgi:hypothetical protein
MQVALVISRLRTLIPQLAVLLVRETVILSSMFFLHLGRINSSTHLVYIIPSYAVPVSFSATLRLLNADEILHGVLKPMLISSTNSDAYLKIYT